MITCTILILTYKGKHHLEHLLPTVEVAIQNSPQYEYEVLIVDNGRDVDTREFVENNYPKYKIKDSIANNYLFSLNPEVSALNSPLVFILNDDMKLESNVLNKTIPIILNDKSLFAVSCNVMDWEGVEPTVGVRVLEYSKGWMNTKHVECEDNKLRHSLFGGGGAAVFNTAMFNELKGFSELYKPAYAEDADLGYRAWHRGWKSIYHPEAILYHRDGATIKEQFASQELSVKIAKNMILLMLSNVRVEKFLLWFFLLLPIRYFRWIRLSKTQFKALNRALPYFPAALKHRFNQKKSVVSDLELIKILNKEYEVGR